MSIIRSQLKCKIIFNIVGKIGKTKAVFSARKQDISQSNVLSETSRTWLATNTTKSMAIQKKADSKTLYNLDLLKNHLRTKKSIEKKVLAKI